MNNKIFTRKSLSLWLFLSLMVGLFSYSSGEYFSIYLDRTNVYPLRNTISIIVMAVSGILFLIALIIYLVKCIKRKEVINFIVILLLSLLLGLFIVEPVVSIIYNFIANVFHLFPDDSQQGVADGLSLLYRWLQGLFK